MDLATPVSRLPFIGPVFAKRLSKLKIETIEDLLFHFPFRYEDYSLISPIGRARVGESLTIKGEVLSLKNEYTRSGKGIQKAEVFDANGKIEIVWFYQPYLIKTLKIGETYYFSGKMGWFGRKMTMISPDFEVFKPQTLHTARLVPVYPETSGLSSKWLRTRIFSLIENIVPQIPEYLPEKTREEHHLENLHSSLRFIHFPKDKEEIEVARRRFSFEELFLIQLAALSRKRKWQKKTLTFRFRLDLKKNDNFLKSLPFPLTCAQKRSLEEILNDLSQDRPMNRLLEGDVGSGKTVVAAGAIYQTYINGFQSVLMAPTEILALQHHQTLKEFLEPLGVKISLLTGSRKETKDGKLPFDLLIGTHALIQKNVSFENLGLCVIDEQHRFGVSQREALKKKGKSPHLLTMTATPIPRTIALTLYGDMDLSLIDEMPEGRKLVKTWVVPPQKRDAAYEWIRKRVKDTTEQGFIICPLIEESETLNSVRSVIEEFEHLKKEVFPDLRLGLLHGRLKTKEKEAVMENFRQGKGDLLVSTPVVEVGVDIPNATIMLIEDAERFGLATLHQLRGRVGRSHLDSFCLLFNQSRSERVRERLKALEKIHQGSLLAELDLQIRGPGEVYGMAQHGFYPLKVASFSDSELIKETQEAADEILPRLNHYPLLEKKIQSNIPLAV